MGMTGGLVRTSEAAIRELRANRSRLPDFIEGDHWAPPVSRVQPRGILGWLLRFTPLTVEEVDPDAVPPEGAKLAEPESHLDLDTAWQPLHFLLTGTAWEGEEPACYLVRGGEELVEDDLGYSSIRALTPDQMSRFDDFLRKLSHDSLRQRFDYPSMVALEIYSKPRAAEEARSHDDEVPRLLEVFDALQSFVSITARRGDGAIVYLT
jgi:hypothetical protein